MNQRVIQGDETPMRKGKTTVVRRQSTGQGIAAYRSNPSSEHHQPVVDFFD